MFIIKFAEPVFASIFGALLLKENIFRLSFFWFSFVLISLGITVADGRLGKLFLKIRKIIRQTENYRPNCKDSCNLK